MTLLAILIAAIAIPLLAWAGVVVLCVAVKELVQITKEIFK